jgi:hypothetical protein
VADFDARSGNEALGSFGADDCRQPEAGTWLERIIQCS